MRKEEIETLYRMLGNQSLSGTRMENSHLKDGSVFFMRTPSNPDNNPNTTSKRDNTYHRGKTKKTTKVFTKNRFRLSLFKLLSIEETTSTNDRIYAIAISSPIIALFLLYAIRG